MEDAELIKLNLSRLASARPLRTQLDAVGEEFERIMKSSDYVKTM